MSHCHNMQFNLDTSKLQGCWKRGGAGGHTTSPIFQTFRNPCKIVIIDPKTLGSPTFIGIGI